MSEIVITLAQLRSMIGVRLSHQGIPCRVVEILEDGPSIVLMSIEEQHIQSDQYGNPKRKVPQTFTIPVLGSDGKSIHPAYLELNLLDDGNE